MHIFSHFYDLSGKGPKVSFRKADKRTGKVYSSIHFKILVFPSFNNYMTYSIKPVKFLYLIIL